VKPLIDRGDHEVSLEMPTRPWTQVAVDTFDLSRALPIAKTALDCGVDWLEVGSPLIYGEGLRAIRAFKEISNGTPIVVDFKARDNCCDLFTAAKSHGADYGTVAAAGNDYGVIEALRARKQCGIGVLADIYGLELHEIPQRARELDAMGVDAICIHFGDDQNRYDRVRQQYDGVLEAKRLMRRPLSCSADRLSSAIQAVKAGVDWVFFGAHLLRDAKPERFAPLRNYIETVHSFRRDFR
jgi:3-keto-L-gulonate-6-phosphate decarboxylase